MISKRTLIQNTLGLTSFVFLWGIKPEKIVAMLFICFLEGDQLKVKLANFKFSNIGDGPALSGCVENRAGIM